MSDAIRGYLLSIVAVCLLTALARSLIPEGGVRRVASVVCALLLVLCALSPLLQLDIDAVAQSLARIQMENETLRTGVAVKNRELVSQIIKQNTQAYILDKADEIGAELSEVTVTAQWSSDGYWYPHEAEIVSSAADDQKSRLSDYIQTQLGISISDQNWSDEANDR